MKKIIIILMQYHNLFFKDLIDNHYPFLLIDLKNIIQSLIKLSNAYTKLQKELEIKIDKLKDSSIKGKDKHYDKQLDKYYKV